MDAGIHTRVLLLNGRDHLEADIGHMMFDVGL